MALSFDEYAARNGAVCPFCGSNNLESGSPDFHGIDCQVAVDCADCRRAWIDEYRLRAYTYDNGRPYDADCPRCGAPFESALAALSRWDSATKICGSCGSDEAVIQFTTPGGVGAKREAIDPVRGTVPWWVVPTVSDGA